MRVHDVRKHSFAETGFAKAGLAREEKKLSLSGGSNGPTVQQERKFGIAADEAGGSRVAGGAEAAGIVVCGNDLPGRDLGVKALQRRHVNWLEFKQIPYERTGTG